MLNNTDNMNELFYRIEQLNLFIYEFKVNREIRFEDYEEKILDIYDGFKSVANKMGE